MGNFKIIKKGYSQLEVDSYIERLRNDYEGRLSEQKDRIFYLKDELEKITKSSDNELMASLVSAVERAKLIENSSKNIYELETKKLNLLYSKMEKLLKDENIYNDRSIKNELLLLIQDCRKSLENNIYQQDQNLKENAFGDPVKLLLSKMIGFDKINSVKTPENVFEEENPSVNVAEQPVKVPAPLIQNPKVVQIKRQDIKEKNDFDKFLSTEAELTGGNFESIMFSKKPSNNLSSGDDYLSPNESGFDLKAAVNPKEELDEIMKAFDFFNDDKKKK